MSLNTGMKMIKTETVTVENAVKVLKSDDIKKFIDEKYDGAVIAFE